MCIVLLGLQHMLLDLLQQVLIVLSEFGIQMVRNEDVFINHTDPRGPVTTILGHGHEVLSCDWNKYNEFVIVTGSVDKSIKIWV